MLGSFATSYTIEKLPSYCYAQIVNKRGCFIKRNNTKMQIKHIYGTLPLVGHVYSTLIRHANELGEQIFFIVKIQNSSICF